jgi:hypothetical protein
MADTSDDAEPAGRCALRLTRVDATLIALVLILSGAGSVWLGQDLNFDLLSYHYYNGYAFVEGRLDRDIAPTGWHTYISPAMDALSYVGMVALPPRVFGFLFGALHGLNVALVYLLALALLSPGKPRQLRFLAGLAALVSAVGPNAASELGTTMGNNLVSIPVLGALLALLWPQRDGRSPLAAGSWTHARLFAAATLCGVASGLRLTAAVDHLALCLVALLFTARERSIRTFITAASVLGVGSLLGFLAVNGLWSARLFERFGNPLFPFANQVFRSGYFEPEFLRDTRWVAREAWDYLRPPLDIALGRMERLQEIGARDARYLLLVVVAIAVVVLALTRRPRGSAIMRAGSPESFVLAYFSFGYVLWAAVFYYYRYMTTLEFVAPLALLVLLRALVPVKALVPVVLTASLAIAAWSRTDSWGRGEWQANWFGLTLPALASQPGAFVLLTGAPISFALPDFPRDARFAHLTAIREKGGTELFDQAIAEALRQHRGPLLLLSSFRVDRDAQDPAKRRPRWVYNPEEDAGPVAERFGLALTDRCEDMRTRRGPLYLCEVEKLGAAAP